MKLWHLPVMMVIITFIVVSMTVYMDKSANGVRAGMLSDMHDNYNPSINISAFSTYDLESEIDSDVTNVRNVVNSTRLDQVDIEQTAIGKLISGGMAFFGSIRVGFDFVENATREIGFPGLLSWTLKALLTIGCVVGVLRFFK